jgi:hypothetical protein
MKNIILLVSILCVGHFAFPKNAAAADPNLARFDKVANRLVESLNKRDYPAIEQDFNQNMMNALPLEKIKPIFESMATQYGKINKLDPAQFTGPDQAVYTSHYEKAVIDIKIALDNEDKIAGLWFEPHADSNLPAPKGPADANSIKKPIKTADSNQAADVNAVEDSNRILGELKKDLADIDSEGQKEIKEWTRKGGERKTTTASAVLENKIELAKMAMEQVIKELNFLKRVAVGEGAKKTAAAIDALLTDRKERLEKLIVQMKEEASRLKEREKTQTRTPRTREGSITPDRSYDNTGMDEKRKKREEAIKKREERMKQTQTQDTNSQQEASEDN